MVKIGFYVPSGHLEEVKQALFRVGAGRIGNYENCCWQCLGQGEFLPKENSNPSIGTMGRREVVEEFRVEMVCSDELWRSAIAALIKAHPYEEPAYDVVQMLG